MSIAERQTKLIEEFSLLTTWEDRYKRIIEMGKRVAPYPEEKRLESFKVKGCQSQVWLFPELKEGRVIFHGDSDALITKGLVALLLQVYSDSTPAEIVATSPDFIAAVGLTTQLSPSRSNGLFAMVKQIRLYGLVYSAKSSAGP